ncbi:MAG: hypothetical protein H6684_13095 [Deltaproteobacteria bacterium]|nr:hypothetical protein [Deltaproteobacteria bacterium]
MIRRAFDKFRAAFEGYLLVDMPAARLGMLRLLTGAFCVWHLFDKYATYRRYGRLSLATYDPIGVVFWLKKPLPVEVHDGLVMAACVLAVLFAAGALYRVTGPAFALLMLWLLTYRNSWTMVYHTDNTLALHLLVLGFARQAADTISVDALFRRRPPPEASWRFGWPIQLMCLITILHYFIAGYAKVFGLYWQGWLTGQAIHNWIAWDTIRKEVLGSAGSPVAGLVFRLHGLFVALSYFTLLVEFGAPAVLRWRKLAPWWCLAAFGMHWGIYAFMHITFPYHLSGFIYLSFFPLERLARKRR